MSTNSTDELLEEDELEIFEELFYHLQILKKRRRSLTMDKIREITEKIFERLKINRCFLDEELLNDFLKQYKINIRNWNLELIRVRKETQKNKIDWINYFNQKLIQRFNKQFKLNEVS